jgi:hypothetical protein
MDATFDSSSVAPLELRAVNDRDWVWHDDRPGVCAEALGQRIEAAAGNPAAHESGLERTAS